MIRVWGATVAMGMVAAGAAIASCGGQAENTAISCVSDGVCQPACAADPDCSYPGGTSTADASSGGSGVQPVDAGAPVSSGIDAGGSAPQGPDAGTVCDRYQIVEQGTGSASGSCPGLRCDGSGLVKDLNPRRIPNAGLTWARFPYLPTSGVLEHFYAERYCISMGMRLPTVDEAGAIAGTNNYCRRAWPTEWSTWTSSSVLGGGNFLVVGYDGATGSAGLQGSANALCVR